MRRFSLAVVFLASCAMPLMAGGDGSESAPVAIELVGNLSPARLVHVEATIPGRVVKIHAEVGDRVRAGDLLVELDERRLRSELEIAATGLELARARCRDLSEAVAAEGEDWSVGKVRLAAAEIEVKRAEATLALSEHRLAEAKVKAPIDGTILERFVEVGGVLDRSEPGATRLFVLADLSELVAVAAVPESRWRDVRKGQAARIGVAAVPGVDIEGEVVRVGPVINPATRSFQVWIAIKRPEDARRLMPGMLARVSLLEGQ